jgi:hypothetical protein
LGSSATITYTTSDVAAGVIDITTGVPVTGATAYATSDIDGSTHSFMGRHGLSFAYATVKYPVGVAPYAFYKWAGNAGALDDGNNPLGFTYHNYCLQSTVALLCDAALTLPLVPGQIATEALPTWSSSAITFGTKAVKTRTYVQATARYNATTGYIPCLSTYPVIGLALENYPVAKNVANTPITSTISGMLNVEVDSLAAVNASGTFFVDYSTGVIFLYSADGQTLPAGFSSGTITYYHYATAPSVYSAFACVLSASTELKPGDFLKCGAASNLVRATPGIGGDHEHIIAQVLGFSSHPQDSLNLVRTAYSPAIGTNATGTMLGGVAGSSSVHLGQLDQMPGSATSGMPDALHYSGGSNLIVVLNLICR